MTAEPLVRDAEVELRRSVSRVEAQGRLVMGHRIVEHAVFEQKVADVHDDRRTAPVVAERVDERGDRTGAIATPQERQSAFVLHQRSLGGPSSSRERDPEMGQRVVEQPAFERGHAGRQRRRRRARARAAGPSE